MTVSTTSNKIIYSGNAADTVFPFTFALEEATNIVVYYTDTDGIITDVTADSTILVNAAIPPNPTPVGGSVTYPTSGSPIALGTFLTIYRDLSEVQDTSLDNQGTLYQPVIEAALDYLTMLTQQIQELNGRAIVVAVSDPDPEPLPPAAQRASMLMGFDSDGNPIAVALTSATQVLVSTAMIPVVEAATLALARTAMGLGNIAVENIGAALQDDGAGAVRFISTPVVDAVGQAVVASFHMKERHATAAITYTNPAASTLFAGFGYYVYALGGDVTFAINAGDAFRGMSNGVSLVIPSGTQVFISTDGVLTWYVRSIDAQGMNAALNLQINATVSGNALTIAIKDRNGNDPSASSPVLIPFRNSSLTSGGVAFRAVTSALSITVPNGAQLGTAAMPAFRVWLVAFDNAGSVVLGVIQTVTGGATPTNIAAINEEALTTGTAIDVNADSAGVFYSNGAVTSKPLRILGHVDFSAGQASAGVWVTAPDEIVLFGLGIKKPGDIIQEVVNRSGALVTGAVTAFVPLDNTIPQSNEGDQFLTKAVTPTSKINVMEIESTAYIAFNGGTRFTNALYQDAGTDAIAVGMAFSASNAMTIVSVKTFAFPGTISSTTYKNRCGAQSGATVYTFNGEAATAQYGGALSSYLQIKERMV